MPEPRHTWVPYVAAAAGAALLLKAVLIIGSGGRVPDGPMAVLYLGGLLLAAVAAVGAGLRRTGALRRTAVAVAGVLGVAVWTMVLSDALQPLTDVVSDATHVRDEVPIGLLGLVLLGLAWTGLARDSRRADREPVAV